MPSSNEKSTAELMTELNLVDTSTQTVPDGMVEVTKDEYQKILYHRNIVHDVQHPHYTAVKTQMGQVLGWQVPGYRGSGLPETFPGCGRRYAVRADLLPKQGS